MFGGVMFPPPGLGGLGLTRAPVDPCRKCFGETDIFGDTEALLVVGYFGDAVLGGYLGDVVGALGPDWPDP